MKIVILSLSIGFVAFGCTRNEQVEQQILFDSKAYFDTAETTVGDGSVYIAGTLTGEGVYYKNNTVAVTCYKDRMECLTNSIQQIGPNHIGRLDSPSIYPVTKWDAYEVVATSAGGALECNRETISIVRKSCTAVWVTEPINQSQAACAKVEARVLKWTIEDAPGWKARRAGG